MIVTNQAAPQFSALTMVIRGAQSASKASKAVNATRAGESLANTTSKANKTLITDTKMQTAVRASLIITKCHNRKI